jgi:hypothetical protein
MVMEDNPYRPPQYGGVAGAALGPSPWTGPLLYVGTIGLIVALVAGLAAGTLESRGISWRVMISGVVVGIANVRASFRMHRRGHV